VDDKGANRFFVNEHVADGPILDKLLSMITAIR
jgi:hypothetical protein